MDSLDNAYDELVCPCCGQLDMNPDFVRDLEILLKNLEFPLPVASGYRCPDYNDSLHLADGKNLEGSHVTGHAISVTLNHTQSLQLVDECTNMGLACDITNTNETHKTVQIEG